MQRYSQTHAQNCILGPPYGGIMGIISILSDILTHRNFAAEFHPENVSFTGKTAKSVSEPPFLGGGLG